MKQKLFSTKQIKEFAAFERVRATGKYNMLDRRGITSTNLKLEDHMFIVKNYPAMRKQYLDELEISRRDQLPLFPELT